MSKKILQGFSCQVVGLAIADNIELSVWEVMHVLHRIAILVCYPSRRAKVIVMRVINVTYSIGQIRITRHALSRKGKE